MSINSSNIFLSKGLVGQVVFLVEWYSGLNSVSDSVHNILDCCNPYWNDMLVVYALDSKWWRSYGSHSGW